MFLFALNAVIAIDTCLASILAANLEAVCLSELTLPLFNVVSDTKMFHSEWANGKFQGIVTEVVAILDFYMV